MKKLIAILVVFALFATTAFAADVSFGAWGRADFVPIRLYVDGNDADNNLTLASTEVNWGESYGGAPAFGLSWTLDGGEIGVSANFTWSPAGVSFDGKAYTWWKPLDAFTLGIGWYRWEVLRGVGGPESFANYCGAGAFGEENLFSRFDTNVGPIGGPGAILQITPIENLYVGASIITGFNGVFEDVFKYSQYALGYDIPGIGLARAGYFGDIEAIQVAFALKAIEGVGVDLGFTYKLGEDLKDGAGNNIQVNLVADIGITDMIKVWFGVNGEFGEKDAGLLSFGLNPTFNLDFGTIGVGAYINLSFVKDSKADMGFDLYLAKDVGGGTFKAGVAARMTPAANDKTDIAFCIPVEITYSIW